MSGAEKRHKKGELIKKLYQKLDQHEQIVVVKLTNVGSSQVQHIRKELAKSKSELVIGKNTVIKKALMFKMNDLEPSNEYYNELQKFGDKRPELSKLLELIKGKVGLIFSDLPPYELKPIVEENKVQTAAKVGVIAPKTTWVPTGPSGLDPSQISFFHALKMSTKIQKGQIEIMKEFEVTREGKAVGQSEATLLQKLGIKPFLYGMEIIAVYQNGTVLSSEVVALTPDDIIKKFQNGVMNITALSLATGIPTEASIPHMLVNAFKNLAGISTVTGYHIKQMDNIGSASAAPAAGSKQEAKKEEAKVEEPPEEEETNVDMGDLFGDF